MAPGSAGKVFLASFAATWPLLFQSMYGVQDVDPVARDTARAYRLGRMRQALVVTLPSAAPYIATGLRVSSSVALILVVTGELVIGSAGVGNAIAVARSGGDVAVAYAYIAVAGLMGLALNTSLQDPGATGAPLAPGAAPMKWRGVLADVARFGVFLLLWQLVALALDSAFLPPLGEVFRAFADSFIFERIWSDVVPSIGRMAAGYTLAAVVGSVPGC